MTPEEIIARLQNAYDNMGTGTRDDLKNAIDIINMMRDDRDEWKQIADDLYKAACGHERPMRALNAYTKALRDRLD